MSYQKFKVNIIKDTLIPSIDEELNKRKLRKLSDESLSDQKDYFKKDFNNSDSIISILNSDINIDSIVFINESKYFRSEFIYYFYGKDNGYNSNNFRNERNVYFNLKFEDKIPLQLEARHFISFLSFLISINNEYTTTTTTTTTTANNNIKTNEKNMITFGEELIIPKINLLLWRDLNLYMNSDIKELLIKRYLSISMTLNFDKIIIDDMIGNSKVINEKELIDIEDEISKCNDSKTLSEYTPIFSRIKCYHFLDITIHIRNFNGNIKRVNFN